MRQADIRKWLKKNFAQIQFEYALDNWSIKVNVEKADPHPRYNYSITFGETIADFTYKEATIILYAAAIPNIECLIATVRHELGHVITSPFDIFLDMFYETKEYKGNKERKAKWDEIIFQIGEDAAVCVERLVKRHKGGV